MSDDDFMLGDDAEDYGFEYESDDGEEPDASLENQYYSAKGMSLVDSKPRSLMRLTTITARQCGTVLFRSLERGQSAGSLENFPKRRLDGGRKGRLVRCRSDYFDCAKL